MKQIYNTPNNVKIHDNGKLTQENGSGLKLFKKQNLNDKTHLSRCTNFGWFVAHILAEVFVPPVN